MKKDKAQLLSIIVPAYCQEKTIVKDIRKLDNVLSSLPLPHEIIIVVDGFLDHTMQNLKKIKKKNITVLGYERNQGKGFAVKYGMGRAKGTVVGFIDAGMDLDPTGINMLFQHMQWYNADIIIGSKLHPVSQVDYPVLRKILSWGYRKFSQALFGFKVRDTQVGLKLFKKKVAKDVFPRLVVKKFAFDIEVLAVAYALEYRRIFEAPIKLKFGKQSSITSQNFWNVVWHMMWDTLAVYYRLKILHYYDRRERKVVKLQYNIS